MAVPQGRRSPRKRGRANSDAERRALAKASGRRSGPPPRAPRPGFAVLSTDGGSRGNPGPAAIGYVLDAPDGTVLAAHGETIGVAGANVAEYRALLAGLEHALAFGFDRVDARCDARLVVEHVADRRRPGIPARPAVGREHREAGPRRARWRPAPPSARLGQGTSLGVAVGTASTAGGSAALGRSHATTLCHATRVVQRAG